MCFKKLNREWQTWGISLFDIQILYSSIAIGALSWYIVTYFKNLLLDKHHLNLYPWTDLFFHPREASFIPYVFLCVVMGIYSLFLYRKIEIVKINPNETKLLTLNPGRIAIPIISSIIVLLFFLEFLVLRSAFNKALLFSILFFSAISLLSFQFQRIVQNNILLSLIGILMIFLFLEPLQLIKGPVYLMNEYTNLYSETLIKDKYVNNKHYLSDLVTDDNYAKREDIEQNHKEFYRANALEYSHQNMSRGQINHIGHILNPINEYTGGKPLKDIYMQYGLGNTLFMNLTMNLFGGMSIDNYYKCYAYYIIYFVLFLSMLFYLFRDSLYVLNAMLIYAISYFVNGYIAFILAPGLIPTVHFFDASVILLLLLFFRRDNLTYLALAAFMSGLSVINNRPFGMILTFSLWIAILTYIIENKPLRPNRLRLISILSFPLLIIFAQTIITARAHSIQPHTLSYFLFGLFSWRPDSTIIIFTILYLAISYYYLMLLKKERFFLKYIYIFVFIYSQGLFTYYYWAGLPNHLPIVIPFIGLQLFLMIFITHKILFQDNVLVAKAIGAGLVIITSLSLVLLPLTAKNFYKGKKTFQKNFSQHKKYNWKFERAHIITTIDPWPMQESVSLIQKYNTVENSGIYILSEYDNLLPFLSKRYSMMPFFDMSWYVFSEREHTITLNLINSKKPEYIFVDTNMNNFTPDPLEKLYNNDWLNKEHESRAGRYSELRKIYNEIKRDYRKIDEGVLLSVYKRK